MERASGSLVGVALENSPSEEEEARDEQPAEGMDHPAVSVDGGHGRSGEAAGSPENVGRNSIGDILGYHGVDLLQMFQMLRRENALDADLMANLGARQRHGDGVEREQQDEEQQQQPQQANEEGRPFLPDGEEEFAPHMQARAPEGIERQLEMFAERNWIFGLILLTLFFYRHVGGILAFILMLEVWKCLRSETGYLV
eukprot:TRINITY_DN49209_c0_g1_i4.p2 TRINITY_DN49209_c0_g1~~TRINITY_DN49209_c0_g1_i4.p2  ORF type:complete len:198 (-),score=59.93 TRINITY_DN49209_c0_g1_i4:1059-1652(-)